MRMSEYQQRNYILIPPVNTILAHHRDDQGIDRVLAEKDQERLFRWISPYVDGVLVGGTTGHGPGLTRNQFDRLLTAALRALPDKRIIVGAIEASDGRVRQKIYDAYNIAQREGGRIAGVAVTPQAFYLGQSPEEIISKTRQIATWASDECKIPVWAYNIPKSGATMSAYMIAELREHPNIVGLKDSSGDQTLFQSFLDLGGPDFTILHGKPEDTLYGLQNGAGGKVDANQNFAPSLVKESIQLYLSGNHAEAMTLHQRVVEPTETFERNRPGLAESRLADRIAVLYLLEVIDLLPTRQTEEELRRMGTALVQAGIPKAQRDGDAIAVSDEPFGEEDLEARMQELHELGYVPGPDQRMSLPDGMMG